jgi:hypothetical protein
MTERRQLRSLVAVFWSSARAAVRAAMTADRSVSDRRTRRSADLAVTANAYSHAFADEAELDYAELRP